MRVRAAASVVLAGTMLLGLTACEFITPQQTERSYQPTDGVNGSVGVVDVRDAFLVTTNGTDASLIVTLINTAATPEKVSVQYDTTSGVTDQSVDVPANGSVTTKPGGQVDITLRDVRARLGALFPISFGVRGKVGSLGVPVLDNTLPGYQTLTPTPTLPVPDLTPSTEPSPTPTDSAEVEPSDSGSPTPPTSG